MGRFDEKGSGTAGGFWWIMEREAYKQIVRSKIVQILGRSTDDDIPMAEG